MSYYYGFPQYVSVGEKRAKAERKLKQLKKKNPGIQPIVLEGSAIAKTWWGKEWNKNLERYADYSNRIGRGRSYVRHGAVLDLQIKPGQVEALVQGSRSNPYSVSISIDPIPKKNWDSIKQTCKGKMDSLKKLIAGEFPKTLGAVFTQVGNGLFPVPKEIHFECSCPDWASMCKHVAATLYGVGARLDQDPNLFFVLRKVDINDLITETVKESKKELLSKAKKKTSRVIEDASGLSDIFGIDFGEENSSGIVKDSAPKKKKTVPKKQAIKKAVSNIPEKRKNRKLTDTAKIEKIIRSRRIGISVSELIKTSGMEAQKVRNVVVQLKSRKKIESIARGVYQWVK